MFTKLIRKTGIAALLVLSAFLLDGAGQARAFSVDVTNLYYRDDSNRYIDYNFSSGTLDNNTINLPETAIVGRGREESGTAYFWGLAPGLPATNVTLSGSKATVSPVDAMGGGVVVLYAAPPEVIPVTNGPELYTQYCSGCHGPLSTSSKLGASAAQITSAIANVPLMNSRFNADTGTLIRLTPGQIAGIAVALQVGANPASWFYTISLANFNVDLTVPKTYRLEIGLGRDENDPRGPFNEAFVDVVWVKGDYNGTTYADGALIIQAWVENGDNVLWGSQPIIRTDLTPASTTLDFDLSVENGNSFSAGVGINGGFTENLGSGYTLATGQFFQRFPDLYPFLYLGEEQPGGGYIDMGPRAFTFHSPPYVFGGEHYDLSFDYYDPEHQAAAVTVTGDRLANGSMELTYNLDNKLWMAFVDIGLNPDNSLFTVPFTFNFTPQTGGPAIPSVTKYVTGYVTDFATNLQPQGELSGPPAAFSWTGIGNANARYEFHLYDGQVRIWENNNISQPTTGNAITMPFSGQLTSGKTYRYEVIASLEQFSTVDQSGQRNYSLAQGTFTYVSGGEQTISFSGVLNKYVDGSAVSGGVVAMVEDPINHNTSTSLTGNFALSGLPAGQQFSLKFTKPPGDLTDYVPTYSRVQQSATDIASVRGYKLFTQADLDNWGVAAGNGIITGRVMNRANLSAGYIGGALVTANGPHTYRVKYQNAQGDLVDNPGTFANGKFFVLDVAEGDTVTVSASHPNYSFPQSIDFITHDGSVSQGLIAGNAVSGRVALGGYVMNSANPPDGIKGATIEQVDASPVNSTVSNNDGSFYLTAPSGTPFHLKFSKPQAQTALAPTYSARMMFTSDNLAIKFTLFPASKLVDWGVTSGKGIIRSHVVDQTQANLGGAAVSAQNSQGGSYPVCYDDACSLSATDPTTGRYIVKNVEPGDIVTVTAQKEGWTFNERYFTIYADSVHAGKITGTPAGEIMIREGFSALVTEFNKGAGANIDTLMSYFSLNYLDDGLDYAAQRAEMLVELNQVPFQPITGDITALTVTGDTATMTVNWGDGDIETLHLAKEGDGVWRLVGNQLRHDVWLGSSHWPNGYYASINVGDQAGITAVTVSGPGIDGIANLAPHTGNGWWFDGNQPFLGITPPPGTLTYNITVYEGATPYAYERTITGFVAEFAVPLSPAGSFGNPLVFSWRGIAGATEYSVELHNDQGERVWSRYDIPANQWMAVYDGPELAAGTYNFNVLARIQAADGDNSSFAQGSFTYTGSPQPTVTYTGNVFDKDGVPASGVLVELMGTANASSAASDVNGGFILSNIPVGVPSYMKFSQDGFVPSYRHYSARNNDFTAPATLGPRSPRIYTAADLSAWGVTAGKGIIRAHVEDAAGNSIDGATVSVTSALGKVYAVNYCDVDGANCRTTGGTDSSGSFSVLDVEEGDMVVVTAQKEGLTFNNPIVWGTHADSVNIGWVRAASQPPVVEIYYSESDFSAATLPTGYINFEDRDTSAGRSAFTGNEYAGITFSSPVSALLWVYPPNLYNYWNSKHLSPGNAPYEGGSDDGDSLTLTFDPAVTAVGWTFLDYGGVGSESIRVYAQDNSLIYENTDLTSIAGGGVGQGNNPFWGISSPDRPIARVEIVEAAFDGDDVAYDNFRFSPVGQVVTNVAIGGYIKDQSNPGVGIDGVTVEQVGATPANSATTTGGGSYSLSVPSGISFHLKFSKDGFAPTYTANMRFTADNANIGDFRLFDATTYDSWSVNPGSGIIRSRVKDQAGNPLDGATVTAFSRVHSSSSYYTVCYNDACDLPATDASGRYIVKNVEPGDTVTVSAAKVGWSFNQRTFNIHADSVHQGGITGTPGAGCSYAVNFPPGPYPASGPAAPYTAGVTAGDGCAWTAYTSDSWLHITAGASGSGNGTVDFTVDANSGAARTGTITIAGQSFTVDQEAGAFQGISVLQNGDFSNGLAGWTVPPSLGDWNPLRTDGTVSLYPPASGYLGNVIFQNLNVTDIADKTINLSLNLTSQYTISSGRTVAVYLTYYDNEGVMHRVRILNPDNNAIGMNTLFNASYDFPADARKLVKLEIVKEDYGEFLADNILLGGDGFTSGPLPVINSVSAASGPYGTSITIMGSNFGAGPDLSAGPSSGTPGNKVAIRGTNQLITSWSDTTINITVVDPTRSGHISVTTDFVQSNMPYVFTVTSPYYSVNRVKSPFKLIKGQKAEFVLNVEFYNSYNAPQGISFTNSNAGLNAFFTPVPVNNPGGVVMKIDTANLATGVYQGNIQANDGSLVPRTVPFTFEVVTVTDIRFFNWDFTIVPATKNYLAAVNVVKQGQIELYNELLASDGSVMMGVPLTFTNNNPSLITFYKNNYGSVDFFAEGASGQTSVNAIAPDGFTEPINFNINIPATPRITSIGLSPGIMTNKYADPISFSATGTQAIGYGSYGSLDIKESTLSWYDQGRSVSGTFKLDLTMPPDLGTYLFNASISDATRFVAAEKVVPLTITNDPSYALMKGGIRSLDSNINYYDLEHFTLEFYNALGVKEFSRDYFGMHHGDPDFVIGAIPPGTYRIKFVPGSATIRSQWWPNAQDINGAIPVTFTAGATQDNYYFFARQAPMISFTGSVRDSGGNPIAGASVYVMEFYNSWATTDNFGNFTLNGIPAGQPFTINVWASGYIDTYSGTLRSPVNIQSPGSFTLLTTSEVSQWQVGGQNLWQEGKGMIMGRVADRANPELPIEGAQISVSSAWGNNYSVTYLDGTTFGGSATAANGQFYIYGLEPGDTVTVTAFKDGWAFDTNTYAVRYASISEQLLFGTLGGLQTVAFTGAVTDRNNNPVIGAAIETEGLDPVIQATSDGAGNFVLSGIPLNQVFHLKISMAGYVPTYSRNYQATQGNIMTRRPYVLRTAEQVYTGWGVTAGKSVIEGRVLDGQDQQGPGIGGVVITAQGNNTTYTVTYKDDAGNTRTDRTYGNGRYFVLNVDPGDVVTVTTKKPSWSFPNRVFVIHADGISQGSIPGTRTLAGVWGSQDIGREAYGAAGYTWWTDAMKITVTDNATGPGGTVNLTETRNEAGTISTGTETSTYSSFTRNADGTYTMWTNEGAGVPPQPDLLGLSEDGGLIILDGAAEVGDRRLDLLVRIDPAKTYGNIDLSGDYYGIGYEHNADPVTPPDGNGASMAISNVTTFNGAGSYTYLGRANSDGQIWTDDQRATPRSYTVNADGSVSMQNGAFLGYLSRNGNILMGSGSYLAGESGTWASYIFLKKADQAYSTADLAGTWAFAGYGDNQGNTRSEFGTLTCDPAGICSINGKTLNDDGSTSYFTNTTTLTVSADGRLGNAPGSTVPLGAIGNGGRTIIWNLSFDPNNLQERKIIVATRIRKAATSPITNQVWAGTRYDGQTFYGDIVVEDPHHSLTSVTVAGPGITGSVNLIYRYSDGVWTAELNLGSTAPADSYYSITMKGVSGLETTVQQRLIGGVSELATNLSPTGDITGKVTFSFTRITGADGYSIDLFDAAGNRVWNSGQVLATIIPYDGPPLASGPYNYAVHSWIGNNHSLAKASFNYTAAVQYPKGDLNHDRNVDLADAIIALRAASGLVTPVLFMDADVNNDGGIGMAEALFAMQTVAGLRVTDHQAAVNGVQASLDAYAATVNAKGAAITPADLLPFFHPAYLNDGLDRNLAVQDDLPDGVVQIDVFTAGRVLFFDNVRKIITIEITFTGTVDNIPDSETFVETFAYDQASGTWLRFGNQRIGEFSVWLGTSRTMPVSGGNSDSLVFHPHFTAPPNTVSQVVVSGPALAGPVLYGDARSETDYGITIERFYLSSQGGTEINFTGPDPQVGDTYTMTVTKKTGGLVTYKQVITQVMLEAPSVTSPTSHELAAANIGSPLDVTWTLPAAGIGLDEIRLEGQVCNDAGCENVTGTITGPTTGTITLPDLTSPTSSYVDVRIHKGGEVFTNSRFEFGGL